MAEMLEVSRLTKRFGGLVAVNDVSFSVREKEILSVIGPNGAGKSTLFKLISSFLRPTTGEVRLK
ncbi:ATP-binding cassette domain-containing protein, partial [Mesorhizobium sp. M2A.F.Ca.ET.040.01.1.1]